MTDRGLEGSRQRRSEVEPGRSKGEPRSNGGAGEVNDKLHGWNGLEPGHTTLDWDTSRIVRFLSELDVGLMIGRKTWTVRMIDFLTKHPRNSLPKRLRFRVYLFILRVARQTSNSLALALLERSQR